MSMIIDSPVAMLALSIANGDLAEAVAVNPKEVLINGKAPGETSLIVWQQGGARLVYDLTVRMSPHRLDAVRQQIARDFPDDDINVTFENDTAFVRGTVKDVSTADRVMAIAASLGKSREPAARGCSAGGAADSAEGAVRQCGPQPEPAIWASTSLSTAFNQSTGISTGQFGSAGVDWLGNVRPFGCAEHSAVPQGHQPGRNHQGPRRPRTCWRCWPNPTCWPSAASRRASSRAANSRSRWCRAAYAGRRDHSVLPRIWHSAQLPAGGYAARHHPPEGRRRKSARSITPTRSA